MAGWKEWNQDPKSSSPSSPILTARNTVYRKRRSLFISLLVALVLWLFLKPSPRHFHRLTYDRSPPSPSPPPHPFTLPGSLNFNRTNPFFTTWAPSPSPKSHSHEDQPPRSPPRLMEKLMLNVRGEEKMVQDAFEDARKSRRMDDDDEEEEQEDFEWLRGRTVVLMGDSLDRYHLLHLCQLLHPSSPLIPTPWPHSNPEDYITIFSPTHTPNLYPSKLITLEHKLAEQTRGGRQYGSPQSRPWVCEIEMFDAVVVWIFLNGLDDGVGTPGVERYEGMGGGLLEKKRGREEEEEVGRLLSLVGEEGTWGEEAKEMPFGDRAFFPIESEHFNPPLASEDRMQQMLLPLLKNLGRGGPRKVDLVEVGVGAWDLGMFRTQDTLAIKSYLGPTLSLNSTLLNAHGQHLTSLPLSLPRLNWYSTRLHSLLSTIATTFPPNHPSTPRISVRTMPVPPQHYSFPWILFEERVLQIEERTKEVVRELNEEAGAAGGRGWSKKGRVGEKGGEVEEEEVVRFSDWAEVVRSSTVFLDHIHPGPIPASWLWADMMLYELRKVVTGIE